ncbi:MAG: MBL fold metallo-hydrolase [Burkholderiaceae bacterium]|nr:MBL fold metallo-hydrolase [Burkholderiaceae bacterium]
MNPPVLPEDIIVFERGWLSSNNILLKGESGCHALVDSGYATHAPQTLALVREALQGEPLSALVNTHLHSDHCGGNHTLQVAHPDLQTLIPAGCAAEVGSWDEDRLSYKATGQLCERFGFDGLLVPDHSVPLGRRRWEVHAAPGHDPQSIVLFEPEHRVLISADALWQHGFGVVFPELEGANAFADVGRTLDLIERLRPRIVIPGHGPVFFDVDAALRRARERLIAFIENPARHSMHAAKVLLKFKLLEVQRIERRALLGWAKSTPYFQLVHARHAHTQDLEGWLLELTAQLAKSGAASINDDWISNA